MFSGYTIFVDVSRFLGGGGGGGDFTCKSNEDLFF